MRFSTILVVFAVEDADLGRVMDGLIEFVLDFLTGSAFERADEVDGGQGEEEARYDFIGAEPVELLPNEDCQTADDDAGQGPIFGHLLPIQGEEDCRAEGGTVTSPGVGDHGQDVAVRIEGHDDGQGRDDEDCQTADVDEFSVAGVLADEGVVEVFGNGRCRNQELGRGRTHDGGQNGR